VSHGDSGQGAAVASPSMDRSTRFLLSSGASAAVVAAALRPVGRFGSLGAPEFVVGLPTSEMPLHTAALQGGMALLSARTGGWRGWRGALGAGLWAASTAGLWRLHRDAEVSAHVLEDALVDGLGASYRDEIADPRSPEPVVPLDLRSVLLPRLPRRTRHTAPAGRDLSYGDAGPRNHLDIWKRGDLPDDARAPVVLQVHGGAWTVGRKEGQAYPLMAHLAECGWVCVAINYRLSPRATWPDHIVDVKRALAWVRANIDRHGGDPDFVAITGGSAGGHLSALAALTPNLPVYQPGFEDADTRVVAAVPFYGVYDFTNRHGDANPQLEALLARRVFKTRIDDDRDAWDLASPISHVRADAPPFFLLHGTNDTVVPVEQGRNFARALGETSGQPVVFAELPRAQHAFDALPSVRAHHTVRAVERFLSIVRSQRDPAAGTRSPARAVGADPR
jgi:acetyl esterase/lipase